MKHLVLVLSLLSAGTLWAQDKPKPVLSADDKVAILQAQKQLLQVANQMQQMQNQYQTLTAQQNQLAKTMNDLVSKAEHEHPGFKLSLDTLEFTAPPPAAKKPEEPKK